MQGWASVLDKWAMAKAYSEEMAHQRAFTAQAMGDFEKRLPGYGSDSANRFIGQARGDRLQGYKDIGQVPLGVKPGWQGAGKGSAAQVDVMSRARAGNAAYGDWSHNVGQQQIDQERALTGITSVAKGQAQVFPYRMYSAQHSWDDLAMIGQAISSIGGGSSNYSQFAGVPQSGGGGGGGMSGGSGGFGGGIGYSPEYQNLYGKGWMDNSAGEGVTVPG